MDFNVNFLILNELSKEEKISKILQKVSEGNITAYKIAKDTGLNESGVGRILEKTTKNPHNSTINILYDYLYPTNTVNESQEFYSENDEIERLKDVKTKPYKLDHYHEVVELGLKVVANWEELKKLDIVKNCIELDVLKAELQRQKEKDLN